MSNSTLHPSRAKFLNLLKQTTSIEFDIVPEDKIDGETKAIRQVASGDHIILKNQTINTYQRAQRRIQLNQSRQQNNLEQVFSLSLEYISQDAQFDRIDIDWMMKFTNLAKKSYSPTMQELWAKILASELSNVGTYSYRSLKTLSELSTKEAMLFYKSVNLISKIGDDKSPKIVTGAYKKPTLISIFSNKNRLSLNLSKFGLSFTQIIALAEIGLVYEQEIESAAYKSGEVIKLQYQGSNFDLKVKQNEVTLTYYKLTQTGFELSKLVSVEHNKSYLNSLLQDFGGLLELQNKVNSSA